MSNIPIKATPQLVYLQIEGSICLECGNPIEGEIEVLTFCTGGSEGGQHFHCFYKNKNLKEGELRIGLPTLNRLKELNSDRAKYYQAWSREELLLRGWTVKQMKDKGLI